MRRAIPVLAAVLVAACQKAPAPPVAVAPGSPDAAAPAAAAEPHQTLVRHEPGTLFGGELGLDHVGIAVRDLAVAKRIYTETLGFGAPQDGKLNNGLKNVTLYFADNGYLELMTPVGPLDSARGDGGTARGDGGTARGDGGTARGDGGTARGDAGTAREEPRAEWLEAFLEKTEGANFVLLSTWDLEETREFLKVRGAQLTEAAGGRIEAAGVIPGTEPLWHTAFFKPPSPLPGGRVGFIAYRRDKREHSLEQMVKTLKVKKGPHPNTARLMRAVWMVVKDLEAAKKAYADVGFEAQRQFEDARLGAKGLELSAGKGSILLLQPSDPKGAAAAFLARRGESLCGVSVEVMSLEKAAGFIQPKTGRTFAPYTGLYGKSFLLPPELTFDVWMELFETTGG